MTKMQGCSAMGGFCLEYFHPGLNGSSDGGPKDPLCTLQYLLCMMPKILTQNHVIILAKFSFYNDCAQIHRKTIMTYHTVLPCCFITWLQTDHSTSVSLQLFSIGSAGPFSEAAKYNIFFFQIHPVELTQRLGNRKNYC